MPASHALTLSRRRGRERSPNGATVDGGAHTRPPAAGSPAPAALDLDRFELDRAAGRHYADLDVRRDLRGMPANSSAGFRSVACSRRKPKGRGGRAPVDRHGDAGTEEEERPRGALGIEMARGQPVSPARDGSASATPRSPASVLIPRNASVSPAK